MRKGSYSEELHPNRVPEDEFRHILFELSRQEVDIGLVGLGFHQDFGRHHVSEHLEVTRWIDQDIVPWLTTYALDL